MALAEIVTDPFLRSVVDVSTDTRDACLMLLELISANPLPNSQEPSPPQSPTDIQLEHSRQRKYLNAHLAHLRGLNREAVLAVRQTKHDTAEARSEVDTLHLQLQNLYYEQRHLRGEISACESYDHHYQQLPMIPVEQFLEQRPDLADAAENELMVARIEHERAEREALEAQRQELLKRKQSLIAENKKRKEDLASLDQDLEKFIDAAKPIQKLLEKEY